MSKFAAKPSSGNEFLWPKYWFTWLLIGLLKLLAKLSTGQQVRVGTLLGRFLYRVAHKRRHITRVNIGLCFSHLDDIAREAMVKQCIIENAIGILETARAWFAPAHLIDAELETQGLDKLKAAHAKGKGVLVIGGHYSSLDMGALFASRYVEFSGMYRPQKNKLLDKVMRESRLRLGKIVDRSDMRTIVRSLRSGDYLWYAPDQDYGPVVSVFAPFFGVLAATITTTSKLAKLNDSPTVIISYHRKSTNDGYVLRFSNEIDNFPTGDEVRDATIINSALETEIRKNPAQYMWVHRRFKTRPIGEPSVY